MPVKKRRFKSQKREYQKNNFFKSIHFIIGSIAIIIGFIIVATFSNEITVFLRLVFAAKPGAGGGGYNNLAGCAGKTARPCYDKLTGNDVNLLGKNGANVFTACTSNAAPNKVGEFIHKTSICAQEKVTYCHDGKSSNYIRKFSGNCAVEPPPPPPPSPEPTPTTGPASSFPFRITYPNGGEQLPYGSHQVVRWEGGDTTSEWPIYLSIVDRDRNIAIREMLISTPNDGYEDWIVDLPLGNYYVYYGQGCRNLICNSVSEWDQSNSKFSVVAGSPVEKVNSSYPLNQSLVVLNPGSDQYLNTGSLHTLKWSGGKPDWNISISLIDNNNWTTYAPLFSNLANEGSVQWTVPAYVPPGQYKLYVSCSNCSSAPSGYTGGLYNYSFYPFNIQ